MYSLLFSWFITLVVEFFIIWLFIREEPVKLLLYSVLINSLTLPLATYSYLYLFPNLILIETVVFLVETVLLKELLDLDYRRAMFISLVANTASFLVGLVIPAY
jgi:hypothetical protein